MADEIITIRVDGLDRVMESLDRLSDSVKRDITAAGQEAATEILDSPGIRLYPPETEANRPPTPYYIRGRGTQRAGRRIPEYNDLKSEKLGTQWYVSADYGRMQTVIGNRASYAPYVHGAEQARHMATKGWRKLLDVAMEKIEWITEIYQAWIDRIIRTNGL